MIQQDIQHSFTQGERVTNAEVRRRLQIIYDRYEIKRRPKSTDLLLYGLQTKRIAIRQGEKRLEGVKIIA